MPIRSRAWSLLLAVIVLVAAPGELAARRAVVTRKDAKPIEGEVVRDDATGVTLLIAGIETPIPRDQIENVEYKATVAEQYQKRRAEIADNNVKDRLALAEWLMDQQAYGLAKKELADLPSRSPTDDEKRRIDLLNRFADEKLKLAQDHAGEVKTTVPKPTTRPAESRPGELKEGEMKLLDEDQINWIRILEVDEVAEKPLVIIPRDVIDQFLKDYADVEGVPKGKDNQNRFRNLKGYEQLHAIFEAQARPLYPKIKLRDDPALLDMFKREVYKPYVMNYCGAAGCHGGDKAGDVYLFRKRMDDTATMYTNYYILHHWSDSRGYILDFSKPEASYLLQFGLPQDTATFRHPDVPGWRAEFRTSDDPRYQKILQWLRAYRGVRRNYPIKYEPPRLKGPYGPDTQPTPKVRGDITPRDPNAPSSVTNPGPPPLNVGPRN